MKKIILLTGNERRHEFFRKNIASDKRYKVIASFCEGNEKSLLNRSINNNVSKIEKLHAAARDSSERDFFDTSIRLTEDFSNPIMIKKGEINDKYIIEKIIKINPDLIVCYGSSLIKEELINVFENRFLNVHLGLSPYYRGSGTNIWALINNEPHMVGATFMYLNKGIDTGKIIHQIRASIFLGDGPHSIGNRLIKEMSNLYKEIINKFNDLSQEVQPISQGKLYLQKDFDEKACKSLYRNFSNNLVENYINTIDSINLPYIVKNKALEKISS
ncbi:formyltransferase family protein [Prochlorococcus marinus]|uniref:formyltransferase family protein n=1 Tax=Prochlorococcus marinus TaxID=1219 RepID=UPI001ADAD3B6|nr:formyltransferase family protein [Prochlorococcus marinus]MBO8219515.1 hypothetical protein [Prochlorococcus marinus CUG1416]MBW3051886.1 hypothetical protein [Prochlorococcus marinus str. MU1416]